MSQENVDIVRRAYVALNERDLDSLAKLNHPDAILDFSRSIGPQKGIYRGSQEFLDAVSAFLDAFQMYELTPLDFDVGPGGQIVVRHRVRARGQGSDLEGKTSRTRHSSSRSAAARWLERRSKRRWAPGERCAASVVVRSRELGPQQSRS